MKSMKKYLATASVTTLIAGSLFSPGLFVQALGNEIEEVLEDSIYAPDREELASATALNQDITRMSQNTSRPQVDISSLTVSNPNPKIGDTVTISMRIVSEINLRSVQIQFRRPSGETFLNISNAFFNQHTGLWELRFPITQQTQEGVWQFHSIAIFDINDGVTLVSERTEDLSGSSFTVSHDISQNPSISDTTPPIIDLSSIIVSHKNANLWDTVTIGIRVNDESEVRGVTLLVRRPDGTRPSVRSASLNPATGIWEVQVPITNQNFEEGLWQIDQIAASDSSENWTRLLNSNLTHIWGANRPAEVDLSAGNFTVGSPSATTPNPEPMPEPEAPSTPAPQPEIPTTPTPQPETPAPTPEPEKPTQPDTSFTPVWNGHNLSPVFDANFYTSKYHDLRHMNAQQAFDHFTKWGMSEGRQAHANFNVEIYRNNYVDLRNAFGSDLARYYLHFVQFGQREGRDGRTAIQTETFRPIWNGHDMSVVFDVDFYLNLYPDLRHFNSQQAFDHFTKWGMSEGRQAHANFNVTAYRNRYSDLQDAFGNDLAKYYLHFVQHGQREGRNGR